MARTAVDRCVGNNVAWYGSVLTPHGVRSAVVDGVWISRDDLPPYYSNAVTVAPGPIDGQVAAIAGLSSSLGRPCSVKDSFGRLDLVPLGFGVLFEAEWIWRDTDQVLPPTHDVDLDWRPVRTAAQLEAWEIAWREHGSPAERRVFMPALLAEPSVHLVSATKRARIVGGFAMQRSGDVIGLSNLFADPELDDVVWSDAVGWATKTAPGFPIVGFEGGTSLERARSVGFRAVGPLSVWVSGHQT